MVMKLSDILKQLAFDALSDDPAGELAKTGSTVRKAIREAAAKDEGPLRRLEAQTEPAPPPAFEAMAEEKTEADYPPLATDDDESWVVQNRENKGNG